MNRAAAITDKKLLWIKRLIWLYMWLLLFEGALRRWIFPGLAGPLLLVRDPVAVAILALALSRGGFQYPGLMVAGVIINLLSFLTTMAFGHGHLSIALYGLRIVLLHFPLIFVIQSVFTSEDVFKMGKAICIAGIPMVFLISAQFFSSQDTWINIGLGGTGTAGFDATGDRFRPPGTFSFTLGLAQYYSVVAAFIAAFTFRRGIFQNLWWQASVVCLILAIPLSISRSLFISVLITSICALLLGSGNSQLIGKMITGMILVIVLGYIATFIPAFHEAVAAFTDRWTAATDEQGGVKVALFDRFFAGMGDAFSNLDTIQFFGAGLGLGTNAGSAMLTGERVFLISEGEWGRLIGEMGPLLGVAMISVRVGVALVMVKQGFAAWKYGNPLSLLITSVAILWEAQGNWAQPTSLGFSVLATGLALAAANQPETVHFSDPLAPASPTSGNLPKLPRGRSTYAEKLHSR